MKLPGKKPSIVPKTINIDAQVEEYDLLRERSKVIDARQKELSEDIKGFAKLNGVRSDTGSFLCQSDKYVYGAQARNSVTLDEKATIALLKQKGLTSAIKSVETVDRAEVSRLLEAGDLTAEEVENLTRVSTTYAIVVKPIAEAEEELKAFALVASSKPQNPYAARNAIAKNAAAKKARKGL